MATRRRPRGARRVRERASGRLCSSGAACCARRCRTHHSPCTAAARAGARRCRTRRSPCTWCAACCARRSALPCSPCNGSAGGCARRFATLRSRGTPSAGARAHRWKPRRTPCTCCGVFRARRSKRHHTPCTCSAAAHAHTASGLPPCVWASKRQSLSTTPTSQTTAGAGRNPPPCAPWCRVEKLRPQREHACPQKIQERRAAQMKPMGSGSTAGTARIARWLAG
mmetsp:Transcript_1510/g.3247  ORF Transcript_1510/g.3247 Transcript_1510/m.3247 type:complete len:225 (+) Transcript_1510:114-788(+)